MATVPLLSDNARDEFQALFERSEAAVRDAAFRVLRDADAAAGVAQRVFLRAMMGPHAADPSGLDTGYFVTAATHEALNTLERQQRITGLEPSVIERWSNPTPGPDEHVADLEERAILRSFVASLPERCRAVVESVVLRHLSHAEAADRLGISVKAVEKQMARARRYAASAQVRSPWRRAGQPGVSNSGRGGITAGIVEPQKPIHRRWLTPGGDIRTIRQVGVGSSGL